MSRLLIGLPFLLIAAYLIVSIRMIPRVLSGRATLRERLGAIAALGPGEVLRQTWKSALLLLTGLVVLIVGIGSYMQYMAYEAAPDCRLTESKDCRAEQQLQVVRVETQNTKSGQETILYFNPPYPSATFASDDVPPGSVPANTTVAAELWRSQVTAVTIGGVKHQSFATQSNAWIAIAVGLGLVLLASTWLVIDLALESVEASAGTVRDVFASPVKRRIALYVLLALFGVLLLLFGLAYVAIGFQAFGMADTLAAIYLAGTFFTLPALILVFVAWLNRAYLNVRALGRRLKHSGWFVTAALLVPPFSLYMPYRLMHEMNEGISAPVSERVLKNWWACAIGWLGLTIAGLTLGSPDPTNTSLSNELSNGMLIGSVLIGLFGIWLTIRLVSTIDSTEAALAFGSRT